MDGVKKDMKDFGHVTKDVLDRGRWRRDDMGKNRLTPVFLDKTAVKR